MSNYDIVSSDKVRVELYGYEDQGHNDIVFQEINNRIINFGKENRNVIFNATNINRKRRIDFCNKMKKYYKKIKVIVFLCPIDELIKRNKNRKERHLPEEKLKQMIKTIQMPTKYEYNYDNITYIYTGSKNYSLYINILEKLKDYDQNNIYHTETLGNHIETVANACKNDDITYEAALYHDIGKPFCKTEDSCGKSHYIYHNFVSAYIYAVDKAFLNSDITNELFDTIFLIENHDNIFRYKNFEELKLELNKTNIGLDDDLFNRLEQLIRADRLR